jgi:outer membrane protein TolC
VSQLAPEALVEQVLARNPSLTQMTAAWQAASARYPQVTALDDPMFGTTIGPGSIGSSDVDFAYRLEVSQKLPFPGKRGLRGQAALAEASAAGHEVEDMRLQLIEAAKNAFYEYYLLDRALAVNAENLRLLKEFRQNAETRYQSAQAPQQDLLQADVEIGRQQERELTLTRMREVVVARMNTLMHLPPDSPLPSPPKELALAEPLPDARALRETALARRPDLRVLSDRIAADEASLAVAAKEFYPDFEVMGAYDAFWQGEDRDLRAQLGLKLNLPVRRDRRFAAVSEAEARLGQRRAELARLTDQVNYQVQESYALVRESEKAVRLYEKTILPAAQANVKGAQVAYTTGKIPFLSLAEAQRNLVSLRDRYYEAIADYHRRRATLERVVGGPLTLEH